MSLQPHLWQFSLDQIMAHVEEAARRLSKTGTSLYAVLELKKGASPEEIKKAYRFTPQPLRKAQHPLTPISVYFALSPI